MKIKVSEATNNQLDYLAAKVLNLPIEDGVVHTGEFYWDEEGLQWEVEWSPTTNGAQGVPIIERELLCINPDSPRNQWMAITNSAELMQFGPTPLVAAMRCFVTSKLGEEVEVPDELT